MYRTLYGSFVGIQPALLIIFFHNRIAVLLVFSQLCQLFFIYRRIAVCWFSADTAHSITLPDGSFVGIQPPLPFLKNIFSLFLVVHIAVCWYSATSAFFENIFSLFLVVRIAVLLVFSHLFRSLNFFNITVLLGYSQFGLPFFPHLLL